MNLFDQYGIKEVADITIYSIHKKEDGSDELYYIPALYLDTLKITTTEKTAENTWAKGGLGNSRLVAWDHDKIINLTLEDALCSPASLGLCWGGILSSEWKNGEIRIKNGVKESPNEIEKISRMEKAFYPRNDFAKITVGSLLPRDGTEDILKNQWGEPSFLERSSVLDGTVIKGFGYVKQRPYKWRVEIETAVKSIAVVPDRFYSVYGKSYPIKRKQTIGINQPSESFKYEIIYMRGYDMYDDQRPQAKIIYHKQMEENIPYEYTCLEDKRALAILDDYSTYPFLKIRVCQDGSIKTFLGRKNAEWNLMNLEVQENLGLSYWIEIPQIDTSQFKGVDLWLRFDSINALSYYLLTKYENDIYKIGTKTIQNGLEGKGLYVFKTRTNKETSVGYFNIDLKGVSYIYKEPDQQSETGWSEDQEFIAADDFLTQIILPYEFEDMDNFFADDFTAISSDIAYINFILSEPNGLIFPSKKELNDNHFWFNPILLNGEASNIIIDLNSIDLTQFNKIKARERTDPGFYVVRKSNFNSEVKDIVGWNYNLSNSDGGKQCCCNKKEITNSIWAYINPKTMMPYDDDYWFNQGEPYFKKSLTLSKREQPLKVKKIFVEAGVFPGMYKIVGETFIRQKETGEDERVQISFPLCKIKSNQTLSLAADGEPTVFNLDVEVATPENGVPMEITFYNAEKDIKEKKDGKYFETDGSTKVIVNDN